jgi:hypothetical protein
MRRAPIRIALTSLGCVFLFGGGAGAQTRAVVGRTCPLTGSCSLAGTSVAVPATPKPHVGRRTLLRCAEFAALGAQSSAAAHAIGITGPTTKPHVCLRTLLPGARSSAAAPANRTDTQNTSPVITACANNPGGAPPCKDGDADGLCDAWERAQRLPTGAPLPDADPNKPDIYLKYDYMVSPTHSHQPPAKAFLQMTSMFAAHGIALHVLAPTAGIPEHQVTTLDPNASPDCAGPDFVTIQQLRAAHLGNLGLAYHYMVFAHDVNTPHDGSLVAACPLDAMCGARPDPTATGAADILGANSIIAFGTYVDLGTQIGIEVWTDTMMHELGHNFGLVHGSLADPLNPSQECMTKKPNYVSVMNYSYQLNGILPATAPGGTTPIGCNVDADCAPPAIANGRCATPGACFCTDDLGPGNNVCYRPDYAEDSLPNLNETTLDENVGIGGPSSLEDIIWYYKGAGTLMGASNGSPIDWNNDGSITNLSGCVGTACPDINNNGSHSDQMDTTTDWDKLNLRFQCTVGAGSGP